MGIGLDNSNTLIPINEKMSLGLNSDKVFSSGLGMDIACPSLIHHIAIFNSDPLKLSYLKETPLNAIPLHLLSET